MIVLVIGGRAQGKKDFIRETFGIPDEEFDCAFGKNTVILHLEKLIREQGKAAILQKLEDRFSAGDCIVSCDEVGMGIVPLEKKDREYRDDVGKVLCEIAKRADEVFRVFAGIGQRIK